MDQPSTADIKTFLEVYHRLEEFEASMRAVRGYGAFKESELPVHSARVVMEWLRAIAEPNS